MNIKYNIINIGNKNNNNINDKKEKYFKADNEYFLQEFKIELKKKSSILFLDRSNKRLVQVQKIVNETIKEKNKNKKNKERNIKENKEKGKEENKEKTKK